MAAGKIRLPAPKKRAKSIEPMAMNRVRLAVSDMREVPEVVVVRNGGIP